MPALRLLVCLGLTVLAAGCGDDDGQDVAAGDDTPVSSPADGSSDAAVPATVVPSDLPLRDVRARPWEEAEVVEAGGAVLLSFTSGLEDCVRVDRVDVERSPDGSTVRLTLYEGAVPDATVCPEIGVLKVIRVAVDPPLADGARIENGAA